MHGPIYWAPDVSASEAKGHPLFAAIQHAGPWSYATHPQGGTLAFWTDHPRTLADYHDAREIAPGLHYHSPRALPEFYDLAKPNGKSGVDLILACGLKITIPVALLEHSHFRLSASAQRHGGPITEYGRLSAKMLERATANDGVAAGDPDLLRLVELALGQRYRLTAELMDDLQLLAAEDLDSILGAIWFSDPKAMALASDGGPSASPISDSAGAK